MYLNLYKTKIYISYIYMSEVEETQNEIIVDFNNNDTFSKIKNKVQEIENQVQEIEDKPKPKEIN